LRGFAKGNLVISSFLRATQDLTQGQSAQLGFLGVHTVAPSSIIA
jgi:hypothetical protein